MRTGKISENVLKRSVLRHCKSKNNEVAQGPGSGQDCAIVRMEGQAAVHVQTARADLPGRIRHAVHGGANNLYCEGAIPKAVLLTILLPVGSEEEELRRIMDEADGACAEIGAALAGGHTEASDMVLTPVVSVTVLGGSPRKSLQRPDDMQGSIRLADSSWELWESEKQRRKEALWKGMDVVMAGDTALCGTALLARKKRAELTERFPWELVDTAMDFDQSLSLKEAAAIGWQCGAAAMHDVSEGGIFGALWEFCECAETGLEADLRKILIRQETIEICECYGWNPYLLFSGGCLLMAVPEGEMTAERLRSAGIRACVIGRTTNKKDRILHNGEEIRFLDKPAQDEIWKLDGCERKE